ncbi:MAG: hypothetical protein AVDCRST_MAG73-1821 [uncultured Thermomicrobiales bacterium]|uniref:Uncharacterized protein n=1 Tax=uncultured Thermomicrobiales bacterium TaxID=1645740 RepID=A0A6J4U4X3_9BACT|nr:MAG: hypothetical protein AVDCRST_MAG73-1821 [uncultured Thermomicrobiales bacterium]
MNGVSQNRPDGRRTARLDVALSVACTLADRDAIGSLHVEMSDRPTYREIHRYRRRAESCGFTLTVTGCSVVLRPLVVPGVTPGRSVTGEPGARYAPWDWARRLGGTARDRARVAGATRLSFAGRRMRGQIRAFLAGLDSLSEGTR